MEPKQLKFGKVIEQDGERIYVKNVARGPHFMKKYNAWGFQAEEVGRMKNLNVSTVRLHVKYEGTIETDMDNVAKGLIGNFGFGNQHFVNESQFRKVSGNTE